MLLYKSWRESRVRFLMIAALLTALCAAVVLFHRTLRAQFHAEFDVDAYVSYVYRMVYKGTVRGLFSLLSAILGLGGLQRERAEHTAGFSLALPVSRFRLVAARAAVGIIQIAALSLLPAAILSGLSPLAGESYAWSQSLQFSALWFVCGSVSFLVWFLASVIFPSGYTAFTVCFALSFFGTVLVQRPALQFLHLSTNYVMSGYKMPYLDERAAVLIGPFPWAILAQFAACGIAVAALALVITRRQDFA